MRRSEVDFKHALHVPSSLTGVDYSTVSVARKRFRTLADQDEELKTFLARIQEGYLKE